MTVILIHAFMTSRLDYCNALLGGCSACLINKLQIMLCSLDPCLFVYFHILSSEMRKERNHSSTLDGAVSLEPSSD